MKQMFKVGDLFKGLPIVDVFTIRLEHATHYTIKVWHPSQHRLITYKVDDSGYTQLVEEGNEKALEKGMQILTASTSILEGYMGIEKSIKTGLADVLGIVGNRIYKVYCEGALQGVLLS